MINKTECLARCISCLYHFTENGYHIFGSITSRGIAYFGKTIRIKESYMPCVPAPKVLYGFDFKDDFEVSMEVELEMPKKIMDWTNQKQII